MKQKAKKVVIGVGMSPELAAALKAEAKRRECPQTVLVRTALREWLATGESAPVK